VSKDKVRVMRVIARMNVGGPAMQVAGLAKLLPSDEFEQRVYAGAVADYEGDFVQLHDLNLDIRPLAATGRGFSSFSDLKLINQLAREMREFRPHIVHSHTAKAGVIARIAANLSRIDSKLVHTFHGHLLKGYFSPMMLTALVQTERVLAKRTDVLITVGSKVRDELVEAGIGSKDQYEIIPPGVAPVDIGDRGLARRSLSLSNSDFVVLFLGRLTRIKRVDRLLDAVALAVAEMPETKVLIAGDGELRGQLEVTARARRLPVQFLGWRSDLELLLGAADDLELLLGAADCLVITSDNEGTPVSLIQASLAGVPTVATNIGSVSEIIEDNVSGLVTGLSPEATAAALIRLSGSASLRSRLGAQAQADAISKYSYQRLVDDHVNLYRRLMLN